MEYGTIVKRDFYLNQLISSRHNRLIKIITGLRRSGKTFLLATLFTEYLRNQNVKNDHIICIALDDIRNAHLHDPIKFLDYIDSLVIDNSVYYLIIDEVQMMNNFVGALNSLLHKSNLDIYVTGSNSKFLSKDVATEFRGRGDEIHIYPLSFSEYYSALSGNINQRWRDYITYGGLPQLLLLDGDEKKSAFLANLLETVYLRDLFERCNIKNKGEFKELIQIMSSSIGSPCNPNKLSNTFKSVKGVRIDSSTIANYLEYMTDAFIMEKAMRYDIKGKKYINTLSKFYFQDTGLRNAVIDYRQMEESHIMENIIYNELRQRGFRVDVGMIEERTATQRRQLEVDFMASKGNIRYYIQSALEMSTDAKKEQELASLKRINDGFKRIIIVKSDVKPYYNEYGFLIIGLFDFLLNPNILET